MNKEVKNMFDLSNEEGFSLPEPCFHQDSEYSYQEQQEYSELPEETVKAPEEKTEVRTTDISHFVNIETPIPEPPPILLPQIIELPQETSLRHQINKIKKGTKDDTVLLNINFKTIIVGFFREKIFLNELSPQDTCHLEQFSSRPPSFKSLVQFCRPPS